MTSPAAESEHLHEGFVAQRRDPLAIDGVERFCGRVEQQPRIGIAFLQRDFRADALRDVVAAHEYAGDGALVVRAWRVKEVDIAWIGL